jgi:hypothetical protein
MVPQVSLGHAVMSAPLQNGDMQEYIMFTVTPTSEV